MVYLDKYGDSISLCVSGHTLHLPVVSMSGANLQCIYLYLGFELNRK